MAWLTSTSTGLWIGLLLIRGLAGICNVPLHPGAAHLVADFVPHRYRTTANGIVTAGALIGIACCYPIYGWLIDRFGWASAFILGGGILMSFGLLWSWFT